MVIGIVEGGVRVVQRLSRAIVVLLQFAFYGRREWQLRAIHHVPTQSGNTRLVQ